MTSNFIVRLASPAVPGEVWYKADKWDQTPEGDLVLYGGSEKVAEHWRGTWTSVCLAASRVTPLSVTAGYGSGGSSGGVSSPAVAVEEGIFGG